jgi:acetylornithine deacetylase
MRMAAPPFHMWSSPTKATGIEIPAAPPRPSHFPLNWIGLHPVFPFCPEVGFGSAAASKPAGGSIERLFSVREEHNRDAGVTRAVEILADLVRFQTVSSDSNLELMRYIKDLLARHGVRAELIPNDLGSKANLFATIGPNRGDGVILSGHTDVVPVADQHWTSDPFLLTHRDDRLHGRGTADMKAFVACALAALDFAAIDQLERPIHLAFSYDEELGCLGAPGLIEHIRERIVQPAIAIVGEPSRMRIIGSHKSVHIHEVTVTGVPAHSSASHLGVSANAIAVRLMHVLLEIAARLAAEDMRDQNFDPPFSTLTIGVMKGGTAANILAAEAGFMFDLRSLPGYDPEVLLEPFHAEMEAALAAHPSAMITLRSVATVPPLANRPGNEAEEFVRRLSGDNSDVIAASFGAEAGQFQQAGFQTVICGPGSIDQAHQPDEFIDISEIAKCMNFMAKLFTTLSLPAAVR